MRVLVLILIISCSNVVIGGDVMNAGAGCTRDASHYIYCPAFTSCCSFEDTVDLHNEIPTPIVAYNSDTCQSLLESIRCQSRCSRRQMCTSVCSKLVDACATATLKSGMTVEERYVGVALELCEALQIDTSSSSPNTCVSGVPQGSALHSTIEFPQTSVMRVGTALQFTVLVRDELGTPATGDIEVALESNAPISRKNAVVPEFHFVPQSNSDQLEVLVNGQPIMGSPFQLHFKRALFCPIHEGSPAPFPLLSSSPRCPRYSTIGGLVCSSDDALDAWLGVSPKCPAWLRLMCSIVEDPRQGQLMVTSRQQGHLQFPIHYSLCESIFQSCVGNRGSSVEMRDYCTRKFTALGRSVSVTVSRDPSSFKGAPRLVASKTTSSLEVTDNGTSFEQHFLDEYSHTAATPAKRGPPMVIELITGRKHTLPTLLPPGNYGDFVILPPRRGAVSCDDTRVSGTALFALVDGLNSLILEPVDSYGTPVRLDAAQQSEFFAVSIDGVPVGNPASFYVKDASQVQMLTIKCKGVNVAGSPFLFHPRQTSVALPKKQKQQRQSPPGVISASYSSSLVKIFIGVVGDTSSIFNAQQHSCTETLVAADAPQFGLNSYCFWANESTLVVALGHGATVTTISGLPIVVPVDASPVIAHITSTSSRFDASSSSGSGGRPLIFLWSTGETTPSIGIPPAPNSPTISVTVTNFLGNQSSAVAEVSATPSRVSMLAPSRLYTTPEADIFLIGDVVSDQSQTLDFAWYPLNSEGFVIPDQVLADTKNLYLSSGTLDIAPHALQLEATENADGSKSHSDSVVLEVVSSVFAHVNGNGDPVRFPRSSELVLDASGSVSDVSLFLFEWNCQSLLTNEPCFDSLASNSFLSPGPEVKIPPASMWLGQYEFTVVISHLNPPHVGEISRQATVIVESVVEEAPVVTIDGAPAYRQLAAHQSLSMFGGAYGAGPKSYQWSITPPIDGAEILLDDVVINVPPNALSPGVSYLFQLCVTSTSGTGCSSVQVTADDPPLGGTCQLSGSNSISCTNWEDIHLHLPLSYKFINYTRSASVSNVWNFNEPVTGDVTVEIRDAVGAFSVVTLNDVNMPGDGRVVLEETENRMRDDTLRCMLEAVVNMKMLEALRDVVWASGPAVSIGNAASEQGEKYILSQFSSRSAMQREFPSNFSISYDSEVDDSCHSSDRPVRVFYTQNVLGPNIFSLFLSPNENEFNVSFPAASPKKTCGKWNGEIFELCDCTQCPGQGHYSNNLVNADYMSFVTSATVGAIATIVILFILAILALALWKRRGLKTAGGSDSAPVAQFRAGPQDDDEISDFHQGPPTRQPVEIIVT